jgi:hypothetical protein
MGCGSSRTTLEGVDIPLDYNMEATGVEEIDEIMVDANQLISNIEILRSKLIDDFDDIAIYSGATSYKDPDLIKLYISFFILAEYEQQGFFNSKEITNEAPLFKYQQKVSPKLQKLYDKLIIFTKGVNEINDFIEKNNIKEFKETLLKEQAQHEKTINEKYNDRPGLAYVCINLDFHMCLNLNEIFQKLLIPIVFRLTFMKWESLILNNSVSLRILVVRILYAFLKL